MARYILIDNGTGYIFGDSADINGRIFTGSPVETAKALDESIGEHGRSYEEVGKGALASNETGYHVYRADIGDSEVISNIHDGQDQEMIDAVTGDCAYVTTIRCRPRF
jgi:hypothetical protein